MLLQAAIDQFLADLQQADKSQHTVRAYRADLLALTAIAPQALTQLNADHLRAFFTRQSHLKPTTRARKQAAVASFLHWAFQQDLIEANPMLKIPRVQVHPPIHHPPSRTQIEAILAVIPPHHLRDQVLFRLLFETGMRVGETLALYVEDVELTPDNEHLTVMGKGRRQRTLLLDDPVLVALLKRFLRLHPSRHGPLFRALKNYQGGPLRYQSVQAKWAKYCQIAHVDCSLHQLRHAHATELINEGVSLSTIRKRLGHQHIQSTLRYAQQSDEVADLEIRAWRRRKRRS